MAAITTGVTCLYGTGDTINNAYVQGYSVNATFNLAPTVADETGVTVTARYDDRKTEISVDMVCITATMPVMGDSFSFEVKAATAYPGGSASTNYVGTITSVAQKGSNKDFTTVSVTALCYEQIAP